jgi:hypothetical protein
VREIVAGRRQTNAGVQTIQVWFRFQVSPAARQAYYKTQQAGYQPQAPGDYAAGGADVAEVAAFQNGLWVERAGFTDVIDPTSNAAAIQTRLQNLYAAANTDQTSVDNAALANWGSSWDGTTWSMKSA